MDISRSLSDSAHLPQVAFNLYNGRTLRGIQRPAHPDYYPQLIAHLCRLEAPEGAIVSLTDDLHEAFAIRMGVGQEWRSQGVNLIRPLGVSYRSFRKDECILHRW